MDAKLRIASIDFYWKSRMGVGGSEVLYIKVGCASLYAKLFTTDVKFCIKVRWASVHTKLAATNVDYDTNVEWAI